MSRFLFIAMIVMCLGVRPGASALAAQTHAHDKHAQAMVAAPLQRWVPDAPLREGMRRAHQAVEELRHYEMGHMSAPMAVDRAETVQQAVLYMFGHCQLAAEPDAALHSILVPLLGAAKALMADTKDLKAVASMRAAMEHYPHYFNDPGWDQPAADVHEMHDAP